jgi:RNA polymerase sigma-70 factor (ECF subfamily)
LLRRLTGDEVLAVDLAQETFLAAYRSLRSWQGRGSFGTWLCGIAVRLYADERRRQTRLETEPLDDDLPLTASDGDPLAFCTAREGALRIERAIADLPAPYREAFVLVKIEGLPYRDAARSLGVPLGTLQSRLWRAVVLLQAAVREMGDERPIGCPKPVMEGGEIR